MTQTPTTKIFFYHAQDPKYGCFSNFSAHPIELESKVWPTVEHWFQVFYFSSSSSSSSSSQFEEKVY
jgi:hypothetical protein